MYFIQQKDDNLIISKEIIPLFQTNTFKIFSHIDHSIKTYTFINANQDYYLQDGLKESGIFELLVSLFNQDIPIDKVYFNLQDVSATKIDLPTLKLRKIPEEDYFMKANEIENEFYQKIKENIEHVLG